MAKRKAMTEKIRKVKFGIAEFTKFTPELFRRIGNAALAISGLGGSYAFAMEDKKIAWALFALAALGKLFTQFFSEEEVVKEKNETVADALEKDGTEVTAKDEAADAANPGKPATVVVLPMATPTPDTPAEAS